MDRIFPIINIIKQRGVFCKDFEKNIVTLYLKPKLFLHYETRNYFKWLC
jgi:hypothetical protein